MSFADDLLRDRTREANEALAALADVRLALERMTADRDGWQKTATEEGQRILALEGKADAFEQVGKNQCAALALSDAALVEARAECARWKADFEEKSKAYAAVYEELTALKRGAAQ